MAMCKKCNTFLPPGYVVEENAKTGEKMPCPTCLFCMLNVKAINYGEGRSVTKRELEKEYKEFLAKVKEDNEILKAGAKGKLILPGTKNFKI